VMFWDTSGSHSARKDGPEPEGLTMRAHQGDRIILPASHLDAPTREGDVLELGGECGEPLYLVRWAGGLLHHEQSHRSTTGTSVPEIGDELAVARARRHLANQRLRPTDRKSMP
jgi:hypothetical protein